MKSIRRTLKKTVNTEKSNKMIYAIAAGIAILVLIFFIDSLGDTEPKSKSELFKERLEGLKTQRGAVYVKIDEGKNSLRIVYDSAIGEKFTVKVFRAVKALSVELKTVEISVVLAEDTQNNIVRSYVMKNGEIIQDR